jgi:hypothetical protein
LKFLPPFPVFPPESAYPRPSAEDGRPGLLLGASKAGKVAYLPADLDRCYARLRLPDQGRFLANLALWACGGKLPFHLTGSGQIDCHLYSQGATRILHLLNLNSGGEFPAWEWVESGELSLELEGSWRSAFSLVSGRKWNLQENPKIQLGRIRDHEVLLFE